MTEGELITEVISTQQSGGNQTEDADFRTKVRRASQRAADAAWNLRPTSRQFSDGTVTLLTGSDAGKGMAPSDMSAMGPKFSVWLADGQREIVWKDPTELFELYELNPSNTSQIPQFYTLKGQSATGRPYVHVYPKNTAALTLNVKNYIPKPPKLVDRPTAPTLADSGVVGLLNGAYTYAVTFETADGETEGGIVSASLTVSLKKITVTNIPVSPVSSVLYRKLYRTVAGGEQRKLVATISDNVTTTYLDNIADGSLGANIPTTANAVTGLEKFPEAHHRTAILPMVEEQLARQGGDGRTVEFSVVALNGVSRMWASEQVQHRPGRAPRYGRTRRHA